MPPLKIVSWNIGLRGLQQLCSAKATDLGAADVHGISRRMGFGSLGAMLQHLDADIVCLQEIKCAALGAPERAIALAQGYESFFSLCKTQNASTSFGRYAGTATFCKTRVLPNRAEEGVTGVLGRSASPWYVPADGEPSERELDGEGRCVLTVHGDLAILNVYVPAVTSDDDEKRDRRTDFKAAFLRALERRCHQLLDEGLRVLVVGDMNITPARIDSAREMQEAPEPSGSHSRPWRTWLSQLLNPPLDSGRTAFADCFRLLHPTQPRAYTCFHVASGAETFNFGSRIDLALLAPPPVLAATSEQTPHAVRTMARQAGNAADAPDAPDVPDATASAQGSHPHPLVLRSCGIDSEEDRSDHLPIWLELCGVRLPPQPPTQLPLSSSARLGGQRLLSSFMATSFRAPAPTASASSSSLPPPIQRAPSSRHPLPAPPKQLQQQQLTFALPHPFHRLQPDLPLQLRGSTGGSTNHPTWTSTSTPCDADPHSSAAASVSASQSAAGWQALFQRANDKIPTCKHGEPAKKQVVRKAGPNQGRYFFSCQRPEGPRSNPMANCGFFQWAAEGKRKREPEVTGS